MNGQRLLWIPGFVDWVWKMEQLQLENLASDCLIDILILLDIKDLTAIADCSRNFRSLARRAFSLKYRNVFNMDENTTPRALRKFGDLIRFIRMKEYYILDEKKVLLISECAPNLVAMRFNQYDWFLCGKIGATVEIHFNATRYFYYPTFWAIEKS